MKIYYLKGYQGYCQQGYYPYPYPSQKAISFVSYMGHTELIDNKK